MSKIIASMILISGSWNAKNTFKMIPATSDCPYNEVIYDPNARALAIVGKEKKEQFHMLERLNQVGEPLVAKRPRSNGSAFEQQRVSLESYYEYYITGPGEIENFVSAFAINANDFAYQQYLFPETVEAAAVDELPSFATAE